MTFFDTVLASATQEMDKKKGKAFSINPTILFSISYVVLLVRNMTSRRMRTGGIYAKVFDMN